MINKDVMQLSPLVLFAYKRLDCLKLTIEALKSCYYAKDTVLYVFSDAAKNDFDWAGVCLVRTFIKSIGGFKKVVLVEAEINNGLAKSIISGVSHVLKTHESVIVMEDDLVVSDDFLVYMNKALNFYSNSSKVSSISGYNPLTNIQTSDNVDCFFTRRTTSWGWATWKNRWSSVNWESDEFKSFPASLKQWFEVYKLGCNLPSMISRQNDGKINSWAIRFLYHHYRNGNLTLYPIKNKVRNIGFGQDATHTVSNKGFNRTIEPNDDLNFRFPEAIEEFKPISELFYKQYGVVNKIKTKFF